MTPSGTVARRVPNGDWSMPSPPSVPPLSRISRPAWLAARARNAVRRPIFIASVGVGAFAAALLALVLTPPDEVRLDNDRLLATPLEVTDTMPVIAAAHEAQARLAAADAALAEARGRAQRMARAKEADTLSVAAAARRDSLVEQANALGVLLVRAENAPLASSYRALGQSRHMAGDPRVQALLDSLSLVERERDVFGTAGGGADPVFIALTARMNEIGLGLRRLAEERRASLRRRITELSMGMPRAEAEAEIAQADTTSWLAERDSAMAILGLAAAELQDARDRHAELRRREAREQAIANMRAPPAAMLMAALVFGVAIGFAGAFGSEMRSPRIADAREAERVTGLRILSVVTPQPPQPERRRRSADLAAPPYIEPGAPPYELAYLHVARPGAPLMMVTVVGEATDIAAVVAANLATIAIGEGRSTVLIDTDSAATPVASALRARRDPGFSDVVRGGADWPEVVTQAPVGRDKLLDLVPAGSSGVAPAAVAQAFRDGIDRITRHYEAVFIVASPAAASGGLPEALPIRDTILCARAGHTAIQQLRETVEQVRAAGAHPLGIVLWNDIPPTFRTDAAGPRGQPASRGNETRQAAARP
jgi:Mrp family chromosome partitioning ATPase